LRFAVVMQTPRDPQSAVYIGYQGLAAALARLGHSVEIVSPGDFRAVARLGGRWVPLVYPVAVARWLHRRRDDFDLVMFHSYSGWLATSFVHRRPRSLVMFHGVESLYHRELREEALRTGGGLSWRYRLLQEVLMPVMLKVACRTASGVACLNQAEANHLASKHWVTGSGPAVLAHGVPADFFAASRTPRPIQHVLFVGQWLPMKGIRYLRDAVTTLLRDNPAMRVTCAGTLVPEESVKAEFPPDVHDRLAVYPRVDQSRLAKLYCDADVFVFPSLYEGFSRAILEAMASGLPIVCTSVGVAGDALKHEESALFLPKRDAPAIVAAIQRLRDNPSLAARLGNAARAAASNYTVADVSQRTIAVILTASGAPAARARRGGAERERAGVGPREQ
jgi:glycosyltransferase involved in cell wall biosynthesis